MSKSALSHPSGNDAKRRGWDVYTVENSTDEYVKYQLDMIIKKDNLKSLLARKKRRNQRNAVEEDFKLWPKDIPYMIDVKFNQDQIFNISNAIIHVMGHTCVDFGRMKEGQQEPQYIKFKKSSTGCNSEVGRTFHREHLINLDDSCLRVSIVAHEILHALGLYHEHMRHDRDKYVTIHRKNIKPGKKKEFEKLKEGKYRSFNKPYDYRSLMHFGKNFVGKRYNKTHKTITMEPKQPEYLDVIGNAPGLSFYDIKILNSMYKCAAKCEQKRCPDETQFLGKDCECYCQGPPDDAAVPCNRQPDTCPKLCTGNGGVCNTSNTCTCPTNKYGSYCQLLLSEKCKKQLLNGRVQEDAGRISITCDRNYKLTIPPRDTDFKCENDVLLTKRHNRKPTCTPIGCGIPDVDADIPANMVKAIYEAGEEIHGLTCGPGLKLVGDSNLRCQPGGTWYGAASCGKTNKTQYRIRVTTARLNRANQDAGTHADVFLTLIGDHGVDSDEIELTRELDGHWNKFEEGDIDVFQEYFNDVGEIQKIRIRLSSLSWGYWAPDVISIYDFSRKHYYRFHINEWIKDNGGVKTVEPNKDERHRQCGDEFSDAEWMYVPHMQDNTTTRDEIGCNLKCVERRNCHGAVYRSNTKKCFWLNEYNRRQLEAPAQKNNDLVTLRTFCRV